MAPAICFATLEYPPTIGGVARAGARLVAYLAAAGFEVTVVTGVEDGGQGSRPEPWHDGGATVHPVPFDPAAPEPTLRAFLAAIRALDRERRFALFHGFFLPAAVPCVLAAAGRPVIASIRGSDAVTLLDDPRFRGPLGTVLARASWVTAVSREQLARAAELAPLAGRSSVIPNAVAMPDGVRWRATASHQGVVGSAGKFREVKRIPWLIEAYAGIPQGLRRCLRLIGYFDAPAEERRVRATIRRLDLAPEVEITGPVAPSEVPARLAGLRVFALSSAHEGLPNTLLEAAAVGVPVVATAVGGAAEVLRHGKSALLVSSDDSVGFGEAIAAVLGDEERAAELSRGARELARELGPERERAAWLALYRRLLAG